MTRAAVVEAHRRLRPTGMAPYPLREGLATLADVADYLATEDPVEIGAGYLLELEGFERTREQLVLGAAVPPTGVPNGRAPQ